MLIQVWNDDDEFDGGAGITCAPKPNCDDMRARGLISPKAEMLHEFEAKTWLEAMTIYHEFMGWGQYKPSILENGEIDPVYFENLDEM